MEGARGLPKSLPEAFEKLMRFLVDFQLEKGSKMDPKIHQFSHLSKSFFEVKNWIEKRGDWKSKKEPKAGQTER